MKFRNYIRKGPKSSLTPGVIFGGLLARREASLAWYCAADLFNRWPMQKVAARVDLLNGRDNDEASAARASWTSRDFPPSSYPLYREEIKAAGEETSPLMRGRYEDVLLRSGLLVMIRDLEVLCDLTVEREVGAAIHLGAMLDGGGYSYMKGSDQTYPFPTNHVSLLATTQRTRADFFIPAGVNLRYIDIRFDPGFLAEILRDTALPGSHDLLDGPALEEYGITMTLTPMSANIRRIAEQIVAAPSRTGCNRLFLEGKILELLALTMAEQDQRSAEASRPSQVTLSAKDRQRLQEARDLLVEDLERTWLLRDLARQVGLNENKLKHGFRQIFGNSVYAYLQDQRMLAAADMLARGDESVTSIALAVGYANPAHFSKIFRRYFGLSPSHYTRQKS
jgi:AraC-like DNA-binding protein